MPKLVVIFNSQVSAKSMGGGDKIVIKIARILKDKYKLDVEYTGCPEGKGMLENNYKDFPFIYLNKIPVRMFGFFIAYIFRIFLAPSILFSKIKEDSVVWSSSDFLPDTLPAFLFKLFNRKTKWISSMFLVARNPFRKQVAFSFNIIFYFISQRISLLLFRISCDGIFVLCEEDRKFLIEHGISSSKIFKTSGGVDLEEFRKIQNPVEKKYDACFVGRFHYQKGLDDLIYVWRKVADEIPNVKLALVGWGDSENVKNLKNLIAKNKLNENIELLGFLDGVEKIQIMKLSKLLLFPSTFESWGVVVVEGIASEIPVVAYDLSVLKDNFKGGIVWIDSFDKEKYFEKTLELLKSPKLQENIVSETKESLAALDWSFVTDAFYTDLQKAIKHFNK